MLALDDDDGIIFHAEADIIVAEGHAIDALRIVMIGRSWIKGKRLT